MDANPLLSPLISKLVLFLGEGVRNRFLTLTKKPLHGGTMNGKPIYSTNFFSSRTLDPALTNQLAIVVSALTAYLTKVISLSTFHGHLALSEAGLAKYAEGERLKGKVRTFRGCTNGLVRT